MIFRFDLIQGSVFQNSVSGTLITRPCLVSNIGFIPNYSRLPAILADSQCPVLYSKHPDPNVEYAVLVGHLLRSTKESTNHVWVDFVYKSAVNYSTPKGGTVLSVDTDFEVQHVETYSTARDPSDGTQRALHTWYKPNSVGLTSIPNDAFNVGTSAIKLRADKIMVVKGAIRGIDWDGTDGSPGVPAIPGFKTVCESAADRINHNTWGTDPRGTWYFPGPRTHTDDQGKSYTLTMPFYRRLEGWYPINVYLTPLGDHPPDSMTEDQIRTGGPPLEGHMRLGSGITYSSVQSEAPFDTLFSFKP